MKYLDPWDKDGFMKAARGAVVACLEKGKSYLHDSRTLEYRWYLKKINDGKEEEQRHRDAQAQAQAFHTRLNRGLEEIDQLLSPTKEDPASYFKNWCSGNGEGRYLGETFRDVLATEWTPGYIPPVEDDLRQSVAKELRPFLKTQPAAAFFLLPTACYASHGVPCLEFYFDVYAVVTIEVFAQTGEQVFNGYSYEFLINLPEPKLLGFYQTTVRPRESHFWQSIPLTVLQSLLEGNVQPPGATVIRRTDELTVYEVKNFEEDVYIPISFERLCRSLGSLEKLKEAQVTDGRTAEMLELTRPVEHKEAKQPLKYRESKKRQILSLFDAGELPSSPRVKDLASYRVRQAYYSTWKREHKS